MLSDSVCLAVSFVCRGYPVESERTVTVKKHHLLLHPHMVRATCPQRKLHVCVCVCIDVCVGVLVLARPGECSRWWSACRKCLQQSTASPSTLGSGGGGVREVGGWGLIPASFTLLRNTIAILESPNFKKTKMIYVFFFRSTLHFSGRLSDALRPTAGPRTAD